MTKTNPDAKTRTASLPVINKSFLPAQPARGEASDVALLVDDILNGTIFGPYLVPVSRRAE